MNLSMLFSLKTWIARLARRSHSPIRKASRLPRRTFRPELESLENRVTPTASITIAAVDSQAHEGVESDPATFRVYRHGGNPHESVNVQYTVSGTATNGVDYEALSGTLVIPEGADFVDLAINPIDDTIPEFPESVIVSLVDGPNYHLGDARQATVEIDNQEPLTVIAGTNLTFNIGYVVQNTTELPILTAPTLPMGASFTIIHSEAHPEGQPPFAHTVGQFSWTPVLEQIGSHEVTFHVTVPGTTIDDTSSIIIQVVPANPAPAIVLGGSTDFENDGQTQQFTWNVTDDDGLGPISVTVTRDGSEIFTSTNGSGSFDFDSYGLGDYALTVVASDLFGAQSNATRSVYVVDDDDAPPFVFLSGSFGSETENQTQVFFWDVSDDSGLAAFSVTVTRDIGNGAVTLFETTNLAQASGSFNFDAFRAGTYQITVTARDNDADRANDDLSTVASRVVVVTATTSTPPVLGNNQRFGIFEGEQLLLHVEGGTFLPEVPGLTASGLPVGATFNLTTQVVGFAAGQFSWTPGYDQAGSYPVTFTISDSQGSDSVTIFIDVIDVPTPPDTQPPVIVLGGSASEENDGQTQQFTWSVTDDRSLGTVSVSVTKDGAEIFTSSQASGTFNFDAHGLGSFVIEVTATDSAGLTATASRSVAVSDDDTQGPVIVLGGSSGEETDGLLQQFTWSTNAASGLSSVSVSVTQDGNEIFTSSAASGTFNFDTYGLGDFVLTVTAIDADNDWSGDRLTASVSSSATVSDDDTQGPVIVLGGSVGTESESQSQFFAWDVSDVSGLSSLEVVITQVINSSPVEIFRTTNTADATGSFNFDAFGPGAYDMTVTVLDGDGDWNGDRLGSMASRAVAVVLADKGAVGDFVWLDKNADGIQDKDEPGIANVTVRLLNSKGGVVNTALTDADGRYGFTGLDPNQKYQVQFVLPKGHEFSPLGKGKDEAVDSNAKANGTTKLFQVAAGKEIATIDAGLVKLGSVGDFVWRDLGTGVAAPNGQQDAGEPGVFGIVVNLLTEKGKVVDTTVTDSLGKYLFEGLDAKQKYQVQFVLPTGYAFTSFQKAGVAGEKNSDADAATGKSPVFMAGIGETKDFDAGLVFSSIGDRVWVDADGNGIQDVDVDGKLTEPGLGGVTVRLLDQAGKVLNALSTDAFGNYRFDGLDPNQKYQLQFVAPPLFAFTPAPGVADPAFDSDAGPDGKTTLFQLKAGQFNTSVDAGLVPFGSVGDTVFWDKNENRLQDDGEGGVAGIRVRLLDVNNNILREETTGPLGTYLFEKVDPTKQFRLQWVLPDGWQAKFVVRQAADDSTKDSDADAQGKSALFTVQAGTLRDDIDAGLRFGAVGDFVWQEVEDADGKVNGIQDGNEEGVRGLTVLLFEENGKAPLQSTTTSEQGAYSFQGLDPDKKYQVQWVIPQGWQARFTTFQANGGKQPAEDSDAQTDGKSPLFQVTAKDMYENKEIDAGLVYGSVGNFVWWDKNADGIQDMDEPGVAGVTVRLHDAGDLNAVLQSVTTDKDGKYQFKGLEPGREYKLQWVLPTGWEAKFSPTTVGMDPMADSNAEADGLSAEFGVDSGKVHDDLDAGLIFSTASGFVWWDQDKDGVQGTGEPGVNGIEVRLLDADGKFVQATTTKSIPGATEGDPAQPGYYTLFGLAPGKDYRIEFAQPSGWDGKFTKAGQGVEEKDSDADQSGRSVLFQIATGESTVFDAGLLFGAVGDRVWLDRNANGLQDPFEPGAAGVTVRLLDANEQTVQTAITDSKGNYQFLGLNPAKSYALAVDRPDGHTFTFTQAGKDKALDSNVGDGTGRSLSFRVAGGRLDATVDAGLIDLTARPNNTIVGPGAVPGNSEYTYTIAMNGAVDQLTWTTRVTDPGPQAQVVAQVDSQLGVFNPEAGVTMATVRLRFANTVPAIVVLEARRGGQVVATKEIVVVQVTVTTPPSAFVYGTPVAFSKNAEGKYVVGPDDIAVEFTRAGQLFGFLWNATVTLTGPQGNRGVDQIRAGFVQHVTIPQLRGQYLLRNPDDQTELIGNLESTVASYLDMAPDLGANPLDPNSYNNRPWYDRQQGATFFDPTSGSSIKTISSIDTPGIGIPLTFEKSGAGPIDAAIQAGNFDATFRRLERISLMYNFNLDVAVASADPSNGASDSHWGQSRVAWTFNGTGNVGPAAQFVWTAEHLTTRPTAWVALGLTPEDPSGDIVNLLGERVKFRSGN